MPYLTLAPWFGQQTLLPETRQYRLLLLLRLLVAGEDPGASPPGDDEQLGKLDGMEIFDHLFDQTFPTVLRDDVRILVLVLVVPTE